MAFGFATLHMPPKDFWALTPRELSHLAGYFSRDSLSPPRDVFAKLMKRYPD